MSATTFSRVLPALLALLLSGTALAAQKIYYQAQCQYSENLSCHYGAWHGAKWADRSTAEAEARQHNARCPGHAAQVFQGEE